jgi:ABC-type branched-subunit amino acid transport system ATPase component
VTTVLEARASGGEAHGPSDSDGLLVLDNLRRSFHGVYAVDGTSFTVRSGGITGLIGPNGAGKSTVINLIGGQLRPDSGQIRFAGREIQGRAPHINARDGLIRTFQTPNMFGRLTVLENLLVGAPPWRGETFGGVLLGRRRWQRHEDEVIAQAREIISRFDMTAHEDAYAGTLSGGQKRILEIMRALMARPRVLLLDEPMAGINPTLARRIGEQLLQLAGSGTTMLMVEHNLGLVAQLCEPVIVMAQGRVLAEGSLAELRQNEEVLHAYLAG